MQSSRLSRRSAVLVVGILVGLGLGAAGPASAQVGGRAPGPAPALPAARVFHDADQAVESGAFTVLEFNQERFDVGDLHQAPQPTRLVAPIPGLYLVGANVTWEPGPGARELNLRVNGNTTVARVVVPGDGFNTTDQAVSTLVALEIDDFVQAVVRQNSGGSLDVKPEPDWSPSFWMTWVGPPPPTPAP